MRRIRKRVLAFIASTGLCLGLAMATGATPAFAQTQICGNGGTGYCLNDWNGLGAGNPIKMFNGNNSHEDFWIQPIGRCGGSSTGTLTCPFNDHNLDGILGGTIVQIRYANTSLCVAANTANGQAVMGACNGTGNGSGGDTGTVFVDDGLNLYNVYYTNQHNPNATGDADVPYCAQSGGNPQTPLFLNASFFSSVGCTDWGGI